MIITLPYPDQRLNPNKRLHWSKVSVAKRDARYNAQAAVLAEIKHWPLKPLFTAPIDVSITFYPPDKRKRDDDNAIASFKAYRDGIADILKVDDADWVVTYRFVKNEPLGKVVVEVAA